MDFQRLLRRARTPIGMAGKFIQTAVTGQTPTNQQENIMNNLVARKIVDKQFEDPFYEDLKKRNMESMIEMRNRGPFWMSEIGKNYYSANTSRAKAQARQASAESSLMEEVIPEVEKALSKRGSSIPPGTSISAGPINMPINQKLTGDEASSIAASEVFTPLAESMKDLTESGIFKSKFGNIGRTYRQFASSQPNALLTSYDEKLQEMQGKYNSIKRYVFGEGGKNLTQYEAQVVMALINSTGKSDKQYMNDLDEATKIIESKARLALGGANSALSYNSDNKIKEETNQELPQEIQDIIKRGGRVLGVRNG